MSNVNNWDKFVLLLWKNWRLQRSHKIGLIIELLLPVVFALLLVFIRTTVDSEPKKVTKYEPVPILNLGIFYKDISDIIPIFEKVVVYTPENDVLASIVEKAVTPFGLTAQGVENVGLMEDRYQKKAFFAGIVFDAAMGNLTHVNDISKFAFSLRFPSELRTSTSKFQITWNTNRLFPVFEQIGPRNPKEVDGGIPAGYLREGFLPLQNALTRSYLKLSSGETSLPEIQMQRYPYPEYLYDPLLQGLADLLAFLILVSFIYPCVNITRGVTQEKEKQLKEVMKIMGLSNWLHWLAWFIKSLIIFVISAFFMTLFLTIKFKGDVAVLTYSDLSIIFVFLIFYVMTLIVFCFLISTWFSKASTAAAVTGLIMFVVYVPYAFLANDYESLSLVSKLGWSLFVNTAMGFGFKVIIAFEGTGEGMQWRNLFTPATIDDELTLGAVILMMCASCIIYMLLALYIEQISPGEYGVPQKWYFPFTSEFWCGAMKYAGVDDLPRNGVIKNSKDAFEPEPVGKHVGVQILNLRKEFGNKVAVKGVSLNMYEDEITVLLGHNGAGKTTTISMLTGLFPPTAGTAIVNGSDIRTNTKGARLSLGICPQHNVLFDDLTVADHIIFFSRLKGMKGNSVQQEVDKYLKMIELENKANALSSTLSGGMKRKLSLCSALCGGTKVVLCDEPSSGLDPSARRQLWNLLQTEKTGRTLLLTTHFMDEADVLGDRIAIMCDGEVKCTGSSFFLKKKYGSGYRLVCVKGPNCIPTDVTYLLRKYIPDIQPESNIGAELSYTLADEYSSVFEKMFRDLENNSEDLNINGYGVGITSMEEVFMKVGSENAPDGSRQNQKDIMRGGTGYNDDAESTTSDTLFSERNNLLQGYSLTSSQWKAMLLKKFLYTKRNWLIFLIQNIMPIFFVVMSIVIARNAGGFNALKPMTIALTQYKEANVVSDTSQNLTSDTLVKRTMENYQTIAKSYGGGYKFDTTGTAGFEDYILNLGKDIQVRINARYVAAATFFENGTITAWLNNQPLHTAPLTVNMVYNAMAKTLLNNSDAEIVVTNWPLPFTLNSIFSQIELGNNLGTQVATNLCFCMCFVSAFYILFLIKERESRAKLLQFVGGIRVWTFWLTQLIYDYCTFIITSVLVVATLACFQEKGLATFDELGRIFLVFLIFGFSAIPFTYLLSFLFKEPAAGFGRVSFLNLLAGLALFIVILVMSFPFYDTKPIADVLRWIFMLFPHFSLAMGLNKLYSNTETQNLCELAHSLPNLCSLYPSCCPTTPFLAWSDPGILPEIIYFLITGVFFFSILIIKEFGLVNEFIYFLRSKSMTPPVPPAPGHLDEDVQQECDRITFMSKDQIAGQNLVLDKVTKYYGRFVAVNQISLCVQRMECFGLLGVNGAGKTTTFKMLTGDERITFGEAYVSGISLKTDITEVYKEIGYCPQFDALLDDLTGKEMLKIFCLLRGVQKNQIDILSEDLAKSFGFMRHMNKQTKAYSGGNKRKLSAAIACIGNPSVIYMDEPTSGIDPAARRQLWNILCRIRDSGKSIVLTSHSMEECEALCTRLAVMVNGEFKCIGSTQHLKNKFSKGLVLKIKIRRDPELVRQSFKMNVALKEDELSVPLQMLQRDVDNIKTFVEENFPEAVLKEQYQGILTFYIPLTNIKWSFIFGVMESNRDQLNVEDYSVSQTTLEEVFLEFATAQKEDPLVAKCGRSSCCSCFGTSRGPTINGRRVTNL